jgi:hypothetical protein
MIFSFSPLFLQNLPYTTMRFMRNRQEKGELARHPLPIAGLQHRIGTAPFMTMVLILQ